MSCASISKTQLKKKSNVCKSSYICNWYLISLKNLYLTYPRRCADIFHYVY